MQLRKLADMRITVGRAVHLSRQLVGSRILWRSTNEGSKRKVASVPTGGNQVKQLTARKGDYVSVKDPSRTKVKELVCLRVLSAYGAPILQRNAAQLRAPSTSTPTSYRMSCQFRRLTTFVKIQPRRTTHALLVGPTRGLAFVPFFSRPATTSAAPLSSSVARCVWSDMYGFSV